MRRGHCLKFDGFSLQFDRLQNPFKGSFEGQEITKDLLRDVVERSISSRLLSDVPIGCFLSGGLDSSIVTKIASKHLPNVSTFSIGFDDLDDPYHGRLNEAEAAREFSKYLGTTHHEITTTNKSFKKLLPEFCNFGDHRLQFLLDLDFSRLEKARSLNIPVLLSGDGADELLGGYSWYVQFQQISKLTHQQVFDTGSYIDETPLPRHKVWKH